MVKKFLRRTWNRYVKLGKGRKKKQVWRKPKGRHNKMREKKRGYPTVVKIGYRKGKNKERMIINNLKDLENVKNKDIILIGKIGKKKKIEIAKKANEMKIKIDNLNIEKILESVKPKETKEEKPKEEK